MNNSDDKITIYAHTLFSPFYFLCGSLVNLSSGSISIEIVKIHEQEYLLYKKYVIHFEHVDADNSQIVVMFGTSFSCEELADYQKLQFHIVDSSSKFKNV